MKYLSCNAEILYREGGFNGDYSAKEALISAGPAAELLSELHPPYRYLRTVDHTALNGAYSEALALMKTVSRERQKGAASALFRLKRARLRDGIIYLNRPGEELCALYETHRPVDWPTLAPVTAAQLDALTSVTIKGISLYLGSSGSFNFGHWIVDDLSRQVAFSLMRTNYSSQPITLVIDSFEPKIDAIRKQSIDLILGKDSTFQVRFMPRGETWAFEDLHYASPTTQHPILKSPDAMRNLAAVLRRRTLADRVKLTRRNLVADIQARRRPRLKQRLYVARRAERSRPLLNEPDVASLLREYDFVRIDPEDLSFAGQIARFANSSIVVGPMGAAMASSIACTPGTPIIHMAHEGWTDPFFWDLACVMGHRFAAVYGQAVGPGTLYRSYTIEIDKLRHQINTSLTSINHAGNYSYCDNINNIPV